jgi:hypothetical protein
MSKFPRPKIGYFYSYCCLFDLYKIETQEDLDDILESLETEEDDPTGLMIFPTLQAAIHYLGDEHTKEEIEETYAKFGGKT